jgi:type IX secretion system PorP/SprF family membrane protein
LGIGVQGGYVVKGFSINNLTFPSQFNSNSGVFDQDLPNNIDQWDESINYPDINLGLVYSGEMGVTEPVLGLSVFHLNNPKKSFLREDDKLAPRVAAYGALQFYLPGSVYFKPHVLSMFQKGAKDILVGLEGGYFFPDKSVLEKLYAGIETRTAFNSFDAVSPVLGIGLYNFELAVSYDVNVSQFRNVSNMRGAIEFTLIYKDFAKVLETITLPCDRY